jgi:peptidoglycan-associated lipoprotein
MTMRKFTPLALALLLALGACSESPQNSGTASGAGSAMPMQSPMAGNGMGAYNGGPLTQAQLAAAKQHLVSIGDRVFFATDSSSLSAAGEQTLDRQVAWLKTNPQIKLVIEGNTDERGTREYNLALGARRAQTVKNYMVDRGIAADRIRTISYGKERPVALGSNPAAWAQNRRAVSVIDKYAH